jgi:CRISPR-associated exonuclease Cas4
MLPLSLLNDFLFCNRRAALKVVEGWRSANAHTARGDIVHEHADLPGYELAKGVTLLRALPVFSERLGLSGKCDIIEQRPDGSLFPVEYKVGKRREFENDDVQLCAQALCLEEMMGVTIPGGAIFHAQSKRRREVDFNEDLRARTEQAMTELRALLTAESIPPARYIEGRCEECSLFEICLPRLTQIEAASATAAAVRRLYQT